MGDADEGDDKGDDEGDNDVNESIVYEEMRGGDITAGEILDLDQPTLGSTSNQLLDHISATR